MLIDVDVLSISEVECGLEVEIEYTCPHCGESVLETICFSLDALDSVAEVYDHECPECCECNNLSVCLH